MKFAEPARLPESGVLLRPEGMLAVLRDPHPLVYLTWSSRQERQSRKLHMDYDQLGRIAFGDGTIDWVLPPGEWITFAAPPWIRGRASARAEPTGRRDDDLRRVRTQRMGASLAGRTDLAGPPGLSVTASRRGGAEPTAWNESTSSPKNPFVPFTECANNTYTRCFTTTMRVRSG